LDNAIGHTEYPASHGHRIANLCEANIRRWVRAYVSQNLYLL